MGLQHRALCTKYISQELQCLWSLSVSLRITDKQYVNVQNKEVYRQGIQAASAFPSCSDDATQYLTVAVKVLQ